MPALSVAFSALSSLVQPGLHARNTRCFIVTGRHRKLLRCDEATLAAKQTTNGKKAAVAKCSGNSSKTPRTRNISKLDTRSKKRIGLPMGRLILLRRFCRHLQE